MATTVVSMSDQTLKAKAYASSSTGTLTWSNPNIGNGNKIASIIMTGYCTVETDDVSDVTINNTSIPFLLEEDTDSEPIEFNIELNPTSITSTTYKLKHSAGMTNKDVVLTNLKITVEYYPSTTQYTVRFLNYNGSIINTQQITIGNAAVAPPAPIATGHTFLGWEQDYSYIGRDMDIAPSYVISPINNIKINNDLFQGIFHNEDEIIRVYCNDEVFYNKECAYTKHYDNISMSNIGTGWPSKTLSFEAPSAINNYTNNLVDVRVRFHLAVRSGLSGQINTRLYINGNNVEYFKFSKDDTDFGYDKIIYENDYDFALDTAIPENIRFRLQGNHLNNNSHFVISDIRLVLLFNL